MEPSGTSRSLSAPMMSVGSSSTSLIRVRDAFAMDSMIIMNATMPRELMTWVV